MSRVEATAHHEIEVVPSEARPYQGRPAGLVTRALAVGVDAAVTVTALAVLHLGWAGVSFLWLGRDFRFPQITLARAITLGVLLFVGICTVGWSRGRTYGGHLLGIRVITSRGQALGSVRALLRALLAVLFPFGLLWSAIDRERRSVQDLVVRTSVIYDWEHRAPRDGAGGVT